MQKIGYSLIDANGLEIKFWGDTLGQDISAPNPVELPDGTQVHGVSGPCALGAWRLVPRMGQYGTTAGITYDSANNQIVVTYLVTPDMVIAERTRRLALGFTYTFPAVNNVPDKRGPQSIGTTPADMVGWISVTTLAQAAINLGAPTTAINIVTNTAAISVTALEWQSILAAAGAFEQPIWAGSFKLQAMSPIPVDYANDSYWV